MRAREEQIKPWGYISPFAKNSLQDRKRCDLTITSKPTVSETMPLYTEEHILEAERRGYERARTECAADTRRLEWLEKLPFADIGRLPNGWEIRINNVRHWDVQSTLREAIDAARELG